MRVLYPYCRHCSISRLRPDEQLREDNVTKCRQCLHPLLLEPEFAKTGNKTFVCPECDGEKSWQAQRCKHCYTKMKVVWDGRFKDNTQEFRDKLKKRISDIADEMGTTNYWKEEEDNSSN